MLLKLAQRGKRLPASENFSALWMQRRNSEVLKKGGYVN
jgi:hypothetical protein